MAKLPLDTKDGLDKGTANRKVRLSHKKNPGNMAGTYWNGSGERENIAFSG